MIALITCVVLIGLMLLGVPVCAAMGGTAAAMFASLGYGNILAVMAQRISSCRLWSRASALSPP